MTLSRSSHPFPIASRALAVALPLVLTATNAGAGPRTIKALMKTTLTVQCHNTVGGGRDFVAGDYSLHAGAEVQSFKGAPAAATRRRSHFPAQAAAEDKLFPTRIERQAVDMNGLMIPYAFAVLPKAPGKYAIATKHLASSMESGEAKENELNIETSARSAVTFTGNGKTAKVSTPDLLNYSEVERTALANADDYGRAGSTVLDPALFAAVQTGDSLVGVVTLPAGAVAVVSDPDGVASAFVEIGADVPGLSAGSLGLSGTGRPVVLRLQLSIEGLHPNVARVQFMSNESPGVRIIQPNGTPIGGGMSAPDYVRNRIQSALVYSPSDSSWSLSSDLDVCQYQVYVAAPQDTLRVDLESGLMAESEAFAAPALGPAGLAILAAGCLGAGVAMMRRRRRGLDAPA